MSKPNVKLDKNSLYINHKVINFYIMHISKEVSPDILKCFEKNINNNKVKLAKNKYIFIHKMVSFIKNNATQAIKLLYLIYVMSMK